MSSVPNLADNEYVYYEADLKYKKYRSIDLKKLKESDPQLYQRYMRHDLDTVEYRVKECEESVDKLLDFSHLDLLIMPHKIPTNIKYLDLSNNGLTEIYDLSGFEHLEGVDVSNNKLSALPKLPSNIIEICCRNNNIRDINILYYSHLERLDCSNNKLNKLTNHRTVRSLVCADNRLERLPIMNKLVKLYCKNNRITSLHPYPKLEELECTNNKISVIGDYPLVKGLFCDKNKITSIGQLPNVNVINCCENKIDKLEFYENLQELICDYTKSMSISRKYKISKSTVRKDMLFVYFD